MAAAQPIKNKESHIVIFVPVLRALGISFEDARTFLRVSMSIVRVFVH